MVLKNCLFNFILRFLALINSNNYTMKTKFNGILTLLLALVVQVSFAQEKTVSGTVSDKDGSLPGVSVLIKGTTKGTDTDFDGKYSIKANVGDVLVFSYLGYETVERKVGAASTINVTLKEGGEVCVARLEAEFSDDLVHAGKVEIVAGDHLKTEPTRNRAKLIADFRVPLHDEQS